MRTVATALLIGGKSGGLSFGFECSVGTRWTTGGHASLDASASVQVWSEKRADVPCRPSSASSPAILRPALVLRGAPNWSRPVKLPSIQDTTRSERRPTGVTQPCRPSTPRSGDLYRRPSPAILRRTQDPVEQKIRGRVRVPSATHGHPQIPAAIPSLGVLITTPPLNSAHRSASQHRQ